MKCGKIKLFYETYLIRHILNILDTVPYQANTEISYLYIRYLQFSANTEDSEKMTIFIGSDIFDRAITQSVCAFNQSSNHLIADFSMIDSFSLHKLHSNYCMSLYGCELWNYNSRYINDMYLAWRKVIRKLFKLLYRTHNYLVCGIVECITVKLDRSLTKFVHSMINSKNSTVRELIAHFLTTESSVFAENCRYLMYKYDISVFAWYGSLYDVMNCIKNIQNVSNEHASDIAI